MSRSRARASAVPNLTQLSLERGKVFSDESNSHQLATMSGSESAGDTAALTIGV